MVGSVPKKLITFGVAFALCATPAVASAAAVQSPPAQISPMIALSIFGSQASAAALCGSAATTAAASSAAMQAPGTGCVLPVVDAPPPMPVAEAPLLPPPSGGIGITPILLGLAGIAILAALIASQNNDNDNKPPVSVN